MTKLRTEKVASAVALERGLFYGLSVFDGAWYVGTREQVQTGASEMTNEVCERCGNEPAEEIEMMGYSAWLCESCFDQETR